MRGSKIYFFMVVGDPETLCAHFHRKETGYEMINWTGFLRIRHEHSGSTKTITFLIR